MSQLKSLLIIVDRHRAAEVAAAVNGAGANYGHAVLASGTARTDWLDILGLDTTERTILTYTVESEKLTEIYRILREEFGFEQRGGGIAGTFPVSAVGGPASLCILSGGKRR